MTSSFCYQLTVAPEEAGQRLDQYLSDRVPFSRSQIKRCIEQGAVQVAGQPGKAGARLRPGAQVCFVPPPPAPASTLPEEIPLVVLYEDQHLIVVDKPAGLVVHPAAGHASGTLVNALLHRCGGLAAVGGTLRPGIVHRLDRGTSGVMVASKNDAAHLALAAQFHAHSVTRRYLALVDGVLLQPSGVFDTLYGRDPRNRKRFSSRVERGKPALTRYQVLARLPAATLVEVTPGTGRTHQIRVHFHDHGHPLVGDPEYGRRSRDPAVRAAAEVLGRQALHARLLGFVHPASNAYLELASPLPADFARALDLLQPPEPPEQPAAASPGRPSGGR